MVGGAMIAARYELSLQIPSNYMTWFISNQLAHKQY
jgi:hypothetical protein